MNNQECTKFLTEIQQNEEYAIRVAQAAAPEDLVALMREIDIQITEEEAASLLAQAKEKLTSGELPEEVLEAVNGGFALTTAIIGGAVVGVVLGLCVVALYYHGRKYGGYPWG